MAAATVDDYLAALPADRRVALLRVRDTINTNLPAGYEEGIQYGMISWYVPLSRYPATYNKQALSLTCLGSKKNYMVLHLMPVYGDPTLDAWFKKAYADSGKKLDMGKGCLRFKTLDALPLDVIGELIGKVDVDSYVASAEAAHSKPARAKRSAARAKAKPKAKPKAKAKAKAKRR